MNQVNPHQTYINYLDGKIVGYVNEVMKMVIPEDALPEEKEKAFRVLTTTTALNVYMESYRSILKNYNINFRNQILELWFAFDNVPPETRAKKLLSKPHDFSRYGGKQWRNGKEGVSILEPQKFLESIVKKLRRSEPEKNFLDTIMSRPQIKTALTMRDIFYNGSTMEAFDLRNPKFKEIEKFVNVLQAELEKYSEYPQTYINFLARDAAFRESQYIKMNGKLSQYLSTTKLKSHVVADNVERENRKEINADSREFRIIAEDVLEICETHFVDLPKNPQQHEAYLQHLIKIIEQDVLNNPNLERTNVEMYSQYARNLYQEYMKKMHNGTLPLRLSYYPEDKAKYQAIVKNLEAFQAHKRAKYEKRKEQRRNFDSTADPATAIMLTFGAAAVIAIPLMVASVTNDYTVPIIQGVGTISALALRKIIAHMNLYRDVEKRFSIKNMRVLPYWLDKTVNPGKYNIESFNFDESSSSSSQIEYAAMPYSYGAEPLHTHSNRRNNRTDLLDR